MDRKNKALKFEMSCSRNTKKKAISTNKTGANSFNEPTAMAPARNISSKIPEVLYVSMVFKYSAWYDI